MIAEPAFDRTRAGARWAYEVGLLRRALIRAAFVTGIVAVLSCTGVTTLPSPAWLAPLFVVSLPSAGAERWRGADRWAGSLSGW